MDIKTNKNNGKIWRINSLTITEWRGNINTKHRKKNEEENERGRGWRGQQERVHKISFIERHHQINIAKVTIIITLMKAGRTI